MQWNASKSAAMTGDASGLALAQALRGVSVRIGAARDLATPFIRRSTIAPGRFHTSSLARRPENEHPMLKGDTIGVDGAMRMQPC